MDPNQTIETTPSRINNVDPTGSNSRTETLPVGPTGTDGMTGMTHTQQIPPIGTSNQERSSVYDRSSPPDRTGARVWNRPGERQAADDLIRPQSSRPISPTLLAQTRNAKSSKHRSLRYSRNLEHSIGTLQGRELAMTSAAEHATAKSELQRVGRNRPRTKSPKKYSGPIAKQIYGKNRGA
ncbi:hypothetical protein YC2023_060676 [Brassica napus]